jgi:hypothetical protein
MNEKQPGVVTSRLVCGTCGSPVRVHSNQEGLYAGPWDTTIEMSCTGPCGQTLIIEYPTQQAVDYKRAPSLDPIIT